MNDPEGFLSRWARRKRDVAKHEDGAADREKTPLPRESAPADPTQGAQPKRNESKPRAPTESMADEPTFDVSSLPSIESITGETDIRPFLAVGVPASLRRAALRRLWAIDPHVRGIVELAENTWDFNAPGVPGFDLSPPTGDIRRMVADMIGKKRGEAEPAPDATEQSPPEYNVHRNVSELPSREETAEKLSPPESARDMQSIRRTELARREDSNAAARSDSRSRDEENVATRRTHGGAMPK